jgi:hypothetical protein
VPGVVFLYGWKSLLIMDPGITAALAAASRRPGRRAHGSVLLVRRLPSVPGLQVAASATCQFDAAEGSLMYIGSRYTQVGDQDLGQPRTFGISTRYTF